MADAMEPAREDVEQEPADELVGEERHDLLPVGVVAAVVLVAEGNPGLVKAEEAPVPGMPYYAETCAEAMFCTEQEAIAAGYRKSRAGN